MLSYHWRRDAVTTLAERVEGIRRRGRDNGLLIPSCVIERLAIEGELGSIEPLNYVLSEDVLPSSFSVNAC